MINYAERYFYLAEPEGGETRHEVLRRRLERAERKGKADRSAELMAELALPPFPQALGYLWRVYLRLRRRAESGFTGSQPISMREIEAFKHLSGLRLAPWECELIERLDDAYLQPAPKPSLPEGQVVVAAASAADAQGVRSILGSVGVRRIVKRKKGGD